MFSKYFFYNAFTTETKNYSETPTTIFHTYNFNKPAFGFASTWFLNSGFQLKGSYENTFRLPDGSEMFGDGINLMPNPLLKPEHSTNANLGLLVQKRKELGLWTFETNLFYRFIEDKIRIIAEGATSESGNLARAENKGVEVDVSYKSDRGFYFDINGTYQDLRNRTRFDENGRIDYTNGDRLPNEPYLYGNMVVSQSFSDLMMKGDHLNLALYSRYVNAFYLHWPGFGSAKDKKIIPTQFAQNIECSYALSENKYNIAFGVQNVLDQKIYDNFRAQKPGRSFYIKMRYFINK